MRRIILGVLAVASVIAAGAPALAQPYPRERGWDRGHGEDRGEWNIDRRLEWMQRRIERGRDDGSLDRREAWRAQRSLNDIRTDKVRWERRNGYLNSWQRDQLQARLDRLNDRLHWLRNNDERRPW
jgi:hypothetical protein